MKNDNGMSEIVIGLLVLVGFICIVGVIMFLSVSNEIVNKDVTIEQAKGDLQSQYQRRADLLPNLVATVQGSAKFEKSTQTEIAGLRSQAISGQQMMKNAQTVEDIQAANNIIDNTLSRLMVVVENYPDLKSTQGFRDLQVQIEGTENRINYARTEYNEAVADYKRFTNPVTFPSGFIASMRGYSPDKWKMFEAKAGTDVAPVVTFTI